MHDTELQYADRASFYLEEYNHRDDWELFTYLLTPSVESILEIPCGAGRNLEWLLNSKKRVICVDKEPAMLEQVKSRLTNAVDGRIRTCIGDLRTYKSSEQVDLILVPDGAFQLLIDNPEDPQRSLISLAKCLTKTGRLMFDVRRHDFINPSKSESRHRGMESFECKFTVDTFTLKENNQYWSIRKRYRYQNGTMAFTEVRMRDFTLKELIELCRKANLNPILQFGDYDYQSIQPASPRFILICERCNE